MTQTFIVQKRPAHGVLNGFYYRVVNVSTGQGVDQNFMHADLAEGHCRYLNEIHCSAEAPMALNAVTVDSNGCE